MKNSIQLLGIITYLRKYSLSLTSYLLLLTSYLILLNSCDKIDPPFTVNNNNNTDTIACPVPQFPVRSNFERHVLLDDFTGFKCVHCPGGHKTVEILSEKYGSKLIAVGIHAGYYAIPEASGNFTYDFRTNEGDELDKIFNITSLGLPQGLIDRITYGATRAVAPAKWEEYIDAIIVNPPRADIQIITDYDSASAKLCSHVRVQALEEINKFLNLSVYIIEDSIIYPQLDKDSSPNLITDYVHHNVLRTSANGTLGVRLNEAIFQKNTFITSSCKYNLKSGWNPRQIYVVAFVYDSETYEVLQAEKVKILD